jgi:HK97 family phage major capsid protein
MGNVTSTGTLFPHELSLDMFNQVKGHSTLAKLSGSDSVPFNGTDIFVFSMDGEASIVGEGENKPAGSADMSSVTMKPVKIVYQHRVTNEFQKMSAQKRIPYLNAFSAGFAKKIARALDICAFHGVNPADNVESAMVGNNCFDKLVTNTITYTSSYPDENIDSAVTPIQTAEKDVTGIAMSPVFGSALGAMKMADSHAPMYPEFRFGANPGNFGGMKADINTTVSFGSSLDRAIVGDFANAFRWGYAENITFEVIEYGDPDGLGDLKRKNQVCLRSEAFIGWAILDPSSFTRIVASNP